MSKPSVAIVWFREDLRLCDNPALDYACTHYDQVIPVYLNADNDYGAWSPGSASRWWLHHSLTSLQHSLRNIGGDLVIRQGGSAGQLLDRLVSEQAVDAVLWNRLYTPAAIERDRAIKQSLKARDVDVRSFCAGLLFEPHEIVKDDGTPYRVFTAYWKRCIRAGIQRSELAPPGSLSMPGGIVSDPVEALALLPNMRWDNGLYDHWQPGEAGAAQTLSAFMDGTISHYDHDRDIPAVAGTSSLSPYLHFGEIAPGQVVNQVALSAASTTVSSKSVERFLAEIGWREFAAYTLFHAPQTAHESMDPRFENFPWQQDDEALVRWQRGQTGLPIIDAGMRQLWHTGWMHNRVRMLVASFLTKNLMIHWYEGARWFWDTLVDADLASNTLGWQWVAGCGTDAAPYFRIFNPVLQSQKFDPNGDYIRRWVPELSQLDNKTIHEPWKAQASPDYPAPLVDLKFSRERALSTFKSLREQGR